jgi:predicted glycoside hydrolase/deacetylase ChbG (UPF0249 family)
MARRLLVVADDFGLTDGVTRGIAAAMAAGVVGATSAMVCVPGAERRISECAKRVPGRVGLHLQLLGGRPRARHAVRTGFVDVGAVFPRKARDLTGRYLEPHSVRREFDAQFAVMERLGIRPSHVDSHHHVHRMPQVFSAFRAFAHEHGLPARAMDRTMATDLRAAEVACADHCETSWYGGVLSVDSFIAAVQRGFRAIGGEGTLEIMTHPGYSDADLAAVSSYTAERDQELAVLTDPALANRLARIGVELIGHGDLAETAAA